MTADRAVLYETLMAARGRSEGRLGRDFWPFMDRAVVVRVDNVAKFYFESEQEVWSITEDFPNVAPPWPVAFFEYELPKMIRTGDYVRPLPAAGVRIGVLMASELFEAPALESVSAEQFERVAKLNAYDSVVTRLVLDRGPVEAERTVRRDGLSPDKLWEAMDGERRAGWVNSARTSLALTIDERYRRYWICRAWTFDAIFNADGFEVQLGKSFEFNVAADGRVPEINGKISWKMRWLDAEAGQRVHDRPEADDDVERRFPGSLREQEFQRTLAGRGLRDPGHSSMLDLHVVFLATSFCHCKNVGVSDQRPGRAERRRAEREGRRLFSYKVLKIEPMTRVLREEGRSESDGTRRALHICRGHFANYIERGLFGRHFGTFWIPQHVRGSADVGVALKDYKVSP